MSVLATSLYQKLPPARDESAQQWPGEGRKLLTFADSRQDAAFFAPYLERTYEQVLRRRLILNALATDDAGKSGRLRLPDVVSRLLVESEKAGLFTERESYDRRQTRMATWLMQEMISFDRRISLEGLGLLHFRLVRPLRWQPPAPLLQEPWNLTADEAWSLMTLLLDTLRHQGAITFPPNVDPQAEDFAPRNHLSFMRQVSEPKQHIFGWLPSRGGNRRLDILERVLKHGADLSPDQIERAAQDALTKLWQNHLATTDGVWREHLPSEQRRDVSGVVYRISHEFLEFVPYPQTAFRCNRCRLIAYANIRWVCPAYGCNGSLEPLDKDEPSWNLNHYRHLYRSLNPIPLKAAEHTAQWTSTQATKVQTSFIEGELNALSCSTTFELGVDVGDLQAVLMRNVPPTTANYIQRAGRAGRRTDTAAFVLTFAQRRSHDLAHFSQPERMVAGKVRPPVISIANEKIVRRHIHSVAFAAFLRWARDKRGREFGTGNSMKVGDFFMPENGLPSGPDLLREFLNVRPSKVAETIQRIVPNRPDLRADLQLTEWHWIDHLWNSEQTGLFDRVNAEVTGDLQMIQRLIDDAIAEKTETSLKRAQRFMGVQRTVRSRDLLGFLGSRGVLPKYGFPTDVVEFRTDHLDEPKEAQQLELQRDLRIALSEYAPGSEVVAAKFVWRSEGIYQPPNRKWDGGQYAICPNCGRFNSDRMSTGGSCMACGQSLTSRYSREASFIRPEYGFVVPRQPQPHRAGESRPERIYASRVYFSDYLSSDRKRRLAPPEPILVADLSSKWSTVTKIYSRYGWLAIVNAGVQKRGFQICPTCGYARPALQIVKGQRRQKPAHKNPRTGRDCTALLETHHLVHEFMTDVLELHFDGLLMNDPQMDLWYSVLYALLEGGSDALGIRRDDLDGTVYRYSASPIPAIVLFDNVPGGAGHVRRISDELKLTFEKAKDRMARDCCGDNTSCYDCLRNFRNQPYHNLLNRTRARDFLSAVLNEVDA